MQSSGIQTKLLLLEGTLMFRIVQSGISALPAIWRDRNGNFAIMFALLAPLLLAAASISIDFSKMMGTKTRLAAIADSAALAASSAMADQGLSETEAKALALRYVDAQLGTTIARDGNTSNQSAVIKIVDTPNGGSAHTYNVALLLGYRVPLSGLSQLIGVDEQMISASSTSESATESLGAVSMYFVLDRSGSMDEDTDTLAAASNGCATSSNKSGKNKSNSSCKKATYLTKMEALKIAVENFASQLDDVDPDHKYVRTGGVSFNSYAQSESPMSWGTSNIVKYVNALTATGGTESSGAMDDAYQTLKTTNEDNYHKNKSGQTPTKYIIFMTDGDNNSYWSDWFTESTCDDAKKKDIEIFTIAFMAPSRGQQLLNYCATDASHYFDAADANGLFDAFEKIGQAAVAKVSRLTN